MKHALLYLALTFGLAVAVPAAMAADNADSKPDAAKTAKKAYKENISLKEACVALGFLTEERFDEVFHPEQMI